MSARRDRGRSGIVLLIVLFFVLLLTTSVATFARRAVVDNLVARHRDAAREAEALARGGVELAKALLIEDRLSEASDSWRVESADEPWALAAGVPFRTESDAVLRLQILDAGSRFNLNALFAKGELRDPQAVVLLSTLIEKVVDEMPGRAEDKIYDPAELAANLVDFVDVDAASLTSGGFEDDVYQRADPPYRAPNQPLLSLDDLRLVDGFDGVLVEALRPYLTVFPYVGGEGINPNTAPPHVLGLLYHGVSDEYRLADADQVRDLLEARERGDLWCAEDASHEGCRPLAEVLPGTVFPPPTFSTAVFTVIARATVGEVTRTVEAVLDRREIASPVVVDWRTR